jgi:DNA-binding transcriptional regulator of glucitol operon
VHSRRSSQRNAFTHLTALVVVPGCLALGWWQVTRALSGNTLSWAYVFEWPIFAGYAVFMWWKLTHDQASAATVTDREASDADLTVPGEPLSDAGRTAGKRPGGQAKEAEEDAELASYNDYLAALNASGRRKHW